MFSHRRRSRFSLSNETGTEGEPTFDLSSLIDVSFLLLIYFLVTSTLQPKEADLGLTLGGTLPLPDRDYISEPFRVDIDPAGSVLVSRMITDPATAGRDLPGLKDRLRVYIASQKILSEEPVVQIMVADEVRSQRFIDVLNCVAGEKVEQVTFGNFAATE
jgi:biopolymer transport protein ExbD